jgi:hypothetical protein
MITGLATLPVACKNVLPLCCSDILRGHAPPSKHANTAGGGSRARKLDEWAHLDGEWVFSTPMQRTFLQLPSDHLKYLTAAC